MFVFTHLGKGSAHMRVNNLELSARQELAVRLLEQSGGASVRELSVLCGVSEMTIRRDLDVLEREGMIRRHHGGAVATRRSMIEAPYAERSTRNRDEKQRIARFVVSEIRDGQSVAIGVGSTPQEVASMLLTFNELQVLTPSLRTALILAQSPAISTVVPGLIVRGAEGTMVGAEAVEHVNQFHFDLAIVGAAGVDTAAGITEYNADEVAVTRAMCRRSARRIVVADSTKLGRVAAVVVSELESIDSLVTGKEADPELVGQLRDAGVEVHQA